MKKVVVTGATGAIGRSLINICKQNGYDVLAVVHRESQRAAELESLGYCKVLKLNLDEYDDAITELKKQNIETDGYELFFHLAWMAPFGEERNNLNIQLENVNSSLAAVKFAKSLGCSMFIGTGSQAEYGRVNGLLYPNTSTFPETGYGIAKLCAGQMTRLSCELLGLRHIWCRVLSVYGPYDRDQTLISYAVKKMLLNEDTEFSPCEQMWDYIYSDDAARALLIAALKGESGKIYMIGGGEARPLKEYIKIIAELTGYKKEIGFGKRAYNDKQVMYLQANMEELERIGYNAQTDFSTGIQNVINYYKNS